MNLWLSPLRHPGSCQKVTTAPCASLQRDQNPCIPERQALPPAKLLPNCLPVCVQTRNLPLAVCLGAPEACQIQSSTKPVAQAAKPLAPTPVSLGDHYPQKEKALSWAPKELKNQNYYLSLLYRGSGMTCCRLWKADVVPRFKEAC